MLTDDTNTNAAPEEGKKASKRKTAKKKAGKKAAKAWKTAKPAPRAEPNPVAA